jgi:two-component system sensor histidine kinase AlgZ
MKLPPTDRNKLPFDCIIPDCCNIGMIFRTLLAVNVAVLAAVLTNIRGLLVGLIDFVESSMLLELATLMSLVALCGVRRGLLQMQLIPKLSFWAQRALCALVPATVAGLLIHLLSGFDWYSTSFTHLTVAEGVVVSGLFGLVLQHYFELRARAFSPALSEARLQALQARIRPHFLFNSLNAVLSLIRTEPRRAETTLEDLADLFRVLMRDTRDMTTLDEEIRLCKQYLAIEKIRLGARLQVEWDTANISNEVIAKAQIAALMLQPLLENAVRYGIEPSREAALIRVQLSRSLDRIEIVVANPLHGESAAPAGNQMALRNIRERLALLYDVEAQLTASSAQGQFEVRLRFPYVKAGGPTAIV